MAYVRRDVTDGVTVMNKDLYDNLQDGIDESKEDLENVKDSVSEVKDQVDTATNIAKGRNRAKVFSTTKKMQEWLSNPENKNLCNVGDNLYIVDVGVPDWWVAEVLNEVDQETGYYYKIAQLETQKVDLTTIKEELEYITESLGDISSIGNETYNSVEKLLRYYIDNDFLPDVNMFPLIPPMTSNTKPSGEASANGLLNAYLRGVRLDEPYVIFAGVSDSKDSRTYFDLDGSNADRYIQYKFDSPKIVKKVSLENNFDGETYYVKTFKIQASTDGEVFNDITGEIAHSKGANLLEYHNIYNNNPYIAYRFIPLTYGNIGGNVISCGPRLQFYGY